MSIGILEGANFHICGENIEGKNITKQSITESNYSIKSDENNQIILTDSINKNKQHLVKISDISPDTPGGKFDPQCIE